MSQSANLLVCGAAFLLAAGLCGIGCGDDEPLYFPTFDVDVDGGGDVALDADSDGTSDTATEDTATEDTATEDTATEDTATEDTATEDTATEDTLPPCDDDDDDGVCNSEDACEGSDDTVDTDDDGIPDGCDACEGSDDTVDTDEDGIPDGCDACEGSDDTVDTDEDGIPNGCDPCQGEVAMEDFGEGFYGCPGSVPFEDAASLCGDGYDVAHVDRWLRIASAGYVPNYHYWTADQLGWAGDSDACFAGYRGDAGLNGCEEESPMRVCAQSDAPEDNADPLGNLCRWSNCGWETVEPNMYLGGCENPPAGYTAGTLCTSLPCLDDDDDGVCNFEDVCEGSDDTVDTDEDGIPDGCDACAGSDDTVDTDEDGIPDGCDACEGEVAMEDFGDGLYGCPGSVPFEDAASLCADGYAVAPVTTWLRSASRGYVPNYNYWTADELGFDGTSDACFAGYRGDADINDCNEGQPMRVCVESDGRADNADPLGNLCRWSNCGWETAEPDMYLGGCFLGNTAGTLCVNSIVIP